MPVVSAKLEHLVEIRALLHHARRSYSDFGLEDLPDMLGRGTAVVGMTDGRIWGLACAHIEDRPSTLPMHAPTRAHLRCLAVMQGQSPVPSITELVTQLEVELARGRTHPLLLLGYGAYDWICQGLARCGFDLLDTVEFFQLEHPGRQLAQRPPPREDLALHLAGPAVLPVLAALDATAFPPHWHFGERDLQELLLRGRVQVAYRVENGPQATRIDSDAPIGYSALCYNSATEAQLARLAVAPEWQGQGVGRALLWDAIADVVSTRHQYLVLNTQRTNVQSQRLYTGMGFRPMGESLPLMGKRLKDEL